MVRQNNGRSLRADHNSRKALFRCGLCQKPRYPIPCDTFHAELPPCPWYFQEVEEGACLTAGKALCRRHRARPCPKSKLRQSLNPCPYADALAGGALKMTF